MEILLNGIGYLTMTFADGSQKSIRTTLNKDILAEYGVSQQEHHIFNISTGKFEEFRLDAVDILVTENKPDYENEVNAFVSQFIF